MIFFVESGNQLYNSLFISKKNLKPPLAPTVVLVSMHAIESVRKLVIRAVSNRLEGMGNTKLATVVVYLPASLERTVVEDIPPAISTVSLFQTYKYLDKSWYTRNAYNLYEMQKQLILAHTPSQLVMAAVMEMTRANISYRKLLPSRVIAVTTAMHVFKLMVRRNEALSPSLFIY
jgi:hypothetical protein